MKTTFMEAIRLFKAGSKQIVHEELERVLPEIAKSGSIESFQKTHDQFCTWGVKNLSLAEKTRHGRIIKSSLPPIYGQVAKILDAVLKAVIYHQRWPNESEAKRIAPYLNPVVDTKMMMSLKSKFPCYFKHWPSSPDNVDKATYLSIQNLVRQIVKDEDQEIIPVQFDDLFREILKRRAVCCGPKPPLVSDIIRRSDKRK